MIKLIAKFMRKESKCVISLILVLIMIFSTRFFGEAENTYASANEFISSIDAENVNISESSVENTSIEKSNFGENDVEAKYEDASFSEVEKASEILEEIQSETVEKTAYASSLEINETNSRDTYIDSKFSNICESGVWWKLENNNNNSIGNNLILHLSNCDLGDYNENYVGSEDAYLPDHITNKLNINKVIIDNEINLESTAFYFYCFYELDEIINIDNLRTECVTTMESMFYQCNKLKNLDLSSFNTNKVTTMKNMFAYCCGLENLDISDFDTSNVTNMENMFWNCYNLQSIDLSNFDTSKVTTMAHMFYFCNSLKNLNLTSFNTKNVTTMEGMFYKCYNLYNLDLSSFNTSKVTTMAYMFSYCRLLENLILSNFDTSQVSDFNFMFDGCLELKSLDLSLAVIDNIFNKYFSLEYLMGHFGSSSLTKLKLSIDVVKHIANLEIPNDIYWKQEEKNKICLTNEIALYGEEGTYVKTVLPTNTIFYKIVGIDNNLSLHLSENYYAGGCYCDYEGNDTNFLPNGIEKYKIVAVYVDNMCIPSTCKDWFRNFESLTTANVENLEISSTTNVQNMFYGCSMLYEIKINSSVASKITDMRLQSNYWVCDVDEKTYSINEIKETKTFGVYRKISATIIKLDSADADEHGTTILYHKKGEGAFKDSACTIKFTDNNGAIIIPKRALYTFDGYKSNIDGKEYISSEGYRNITNWKDDEFDTQEIVTLTAIWNKITHKVMFDMNGITNEELPSQKIEHGDKAVKPSIPEIDEYIFKGWYKEKDSINLFDFNTPIETDITLYAKWIKQPKWTVRFDIKEYSEETIESQIIYDGECVKEPEIPKCEGYEFAYWYEKDKNEAFDFNTEITKDIVLYMLANEKTYTIAYDLAGGVWADEDMIKKSRKYTEKVVLPTASDVKKEGSSFVGWYENSQYNGNQIKEVPEKCAENKKYYLKWSNELLYKVEFDNSGHSQEIKEQMVKAGEKAKKPEVQMSETGYEFMYWYENDETKPYDFNTKITKDIVLKAKWKDDESLNSEEDANTEQTTKTDPLKSDATNCIVRKEDIKIDERTFEWRYNKGTDTWSINLQKDNKENDDTLARNNFYNLNGSIYYFDDSGNMATGWLKDTNGNYYAMEWKENEYTGTMITGWRTISGNDYYFGKDGKLLVDDYTPDGYYVNEEGICTNVKRKEMNRGKEI